ncbi:MAG: hypothetical protein J3R72DRAFT_429088 [Linnemannia gamsii]|nr:MAG: hypothetical protein J3R72DRAFT_429088 [Linnemannia gamsii]
MTTSIFDLVLAFVSVALGVVVRAEVVMAKTEAIVFVALVVALVVAVHTYPVQNTKQTPRQSSEPPLPTQRPD